MSTLELTGAPAEQLTWVPIYHSVQNWVEAVVSTHKCSECSSNILQLPNSVEFVIKIPRK